MAERVGFEPTVPLPGQQFSRLPDSAALAPLRVLVRLTLGGTGKPPFNSAATGAYPASRHFSIGFPAGRSSGFPSSSRHLIPGIFTMIFGPKLGFLLWFWEFVYYVVCWRSVLRGNSLVGILIN
ncbi:protein of unknown function [Nitrospira japonica]|uniref:Uncharacterized protein n=1 Tax=Nitrospira japonica TaxID=1325564 RepID=A0A1W1I821_9BACT|nr:protein of unknown function [Nitrospira japonica]